MSRPHHGYDVSSPRSTRSMSISSDRPSLFGASLILNRVHPPPQYVAFAAASQMVSDAVPLDEEEEDEYNLNPEDGALFSEGALTSLNAFLDYLLYSFLATARATSLKALRPAIADVLKARLARDAIASANEDLEELLSGSEDEEELSTVESGLDPSGKFDPELVWRRTRLRVMVYIRLGEMEDEDEERYLEQDGPTYYPDGTEKRFPQGSGLVSWASAIFLTSILEYLAEQIINVAGQAAFDRTFSRKRRSTPSSERGTPRITVEGEDMEKVALNSTLSRLWRTWRKRVRANTMSLSSPPSRTGTRSHAKRGSVDTEGGSYYGDDEMRSSMEVPPLPEQEPSEHDIAANIPLPITDNDVNEIEVPGLAREITDDDEEVGEALTSSPMQYRPWRHSFHGPLVGLKREAIDEDGRLHHAEDLDYEPVQGPSYKRQRSLSLPGVTQPVLALRAPSTADLEQPIPVDEEATDEYDEEDQEREIPAGQADEAIEGAEPQPKAVPSKESKHSSMGGYVAGAATAASGALAAALGYKYRQKRESLREGDASSTRVEPADSDFIDSTRTSGEQPAETHREVVRIASKSSELSHSSYVTSESHSVSPVEAEHPVVSTGPVPVHIDDARTPVQEPTGYMHDIGVARTADRSIPVSPVPSPGQAHSQEAFRDDDLAPVSPIDHALDHTLTPPSHVRHRRPSGDAPPSPLTEEAVTPNEYVHQPRPQPLASHPANRDTVELPIQGIPLYDDSPPSPPPPKRHPNKRDGFVANIPRNEEHPQRQASLQALEENSAMRTIPPDYPSRVRDSTADLQPQPLRVKQTPSTQAYQAKPASPSMRGSPPVHGTQQSRASNASVPKQNFDTSTSDAAVKNKDFDSLIQGGETVKYTLTPQGMRDIDTPATTLVPADVSGRNRTASGTRPYPEPAVQPGSPTSPTARQTPRVTGRSPPKAQPSRPGALVARDARINNESTRDFAEFIRSTGPDREQGPVQPLVTSQHQRMGSDSQASGSQAGSRTSRIGRSTSLRSGSKTSSTSTPQRKYQARDAKAVSGSGTDDLVDFLRQGPAGASTGPIGGGSRGSTAAASRGVNGMPAVKGPASTSTQDTFVSRSTDGGSINSRTNLISAPAPGRPPKSQSNGARAPPGRGFDEPPDAFGGNMPEKKRMRIKDPYAIDLDEEDEEDMADLMHGRRPPPRQGQEESLMDFLRNTEPPVNNQPKAFRPPGMSNGASAGPRAANDPRSTRPQGNVTAGRVPSNPIAQPPSMPGSRTTSRTPTTGPLPPVGPTASNRPRPKYQTREAGSLVNTRSGTDDLAAFLRDSGPPDDGMAGGPAAPAPFVSRMRSESQDKKAGKKTPWGKKKDAL